MSRRAMFLLLFGGIWCALGYGILTVPPSPIQRAAVAPLLLIVSYSTLGWLWVASGVIAALSALLRRFWAPLDREGFYALMVPPIAWSASYLVTAARTGTPRFVVGTLVYSALCLAVGLVSGGVEGPVPLRPRKSR